MVEVTQLRVLIKRGKQVYSSRVYFKSINFKTFIKNYKILYTDTRPIKLSVKIETITLQQRNEM